MAIKTHLDTAGACWTLSLRGDLDFGECAGVRMTLDRILMASPRAAVVDLSGLRYLDSSGLGLLLALSKGLNLRGGKLVLVTNRMIDDVLSLTRLGSIFSTAGSMDEALQIAEPTTV